MDNNVTINANVVDGNSINPNVDSGAVIQTNVSFGTPITASVVTGGKGDKGDTGDTGPIGPTGPQGPIGLTGSQGPQGDPGADGIDGATWSQGSGAPSGGVDGDFYFRTSNSDVYQKIAGVWTVVANIEGATGPTGLTGPAGADGKTLLNGTVAPTTEGVNGDFYINTTTDEIYGPKTGGAWGSGTSIIGPAGPPGSGSGDVNGPASSVDSEIALFSGTSGKIIKRASITGLIKAASGVIGAAVAGTDYYNPGGTDVAVADGGTGASTAAAARTNLGLVIGTDVLAPNGSAAALTSFPTLNQNTTGSAATLTTPRTIDGQSFNGSANITVIAPGTTAATAKTTPVDADVMPLVDSAASNVLKKVTWANIKATLKTYFDSLTTTLTNKTISGASNTLTNIGNTSLTNSSVTIGSTSVALGATAATLAGVTLTTPTIGSFANANHTHADAAGGGKITQAGLNLSKTTDANGWTKYDYGNWHEFRKRVTFSQTIAGGAVLSMSSANLPSGLATIAGYFFDYNYAVTSNAFALSIVAEMGSANASINFTTCTNDGVSRSYSGFIDLTLTFSV